MSIKAARAEAERHIENARAGLHPDDLNQDELDRDKHLYPKISGKYLQEHVARELADNTYKQYKGIIRHQVTKKWKHKPIQSITYQAVKEAVDNIAGPIFDERGMLTGYERGTLGNRSKAVFQAFFKWCFEEGYLLPTEPNPASNIKRPLKREPPRERDLSPGEIKLLWETLDAIGYPYGPCYKFLLITAQRKSEVAGLKWSDLKTIKQEFDNKTHEYLCWTQSANKSGRKHVVPLPPLAAKLLKDLKKDYHVGDYVFTTTGDKPVNGFSKIKRRIDKAIQKAEPGELFQESWQNHDMRRTATTQMRALGIPASVCARLLNHAEIGVTSRVYDQYDMLPEKAEALKKWADYLERLTNADNSNVSELRRAI
ncbi:MAG: site-specific integrase, partial [Nitrospira sp.]|nr:site-specific integrase [Nitrospira sp.]